MGTGRRLDLALVERGVAASRSRAADLVKRGLVLVDGEPAAKPGQLVRDSAELRLKDETPDYVSRSALKLLAALERFSIDVKGKAALDLGASTGGFCEVLLQAGARLVYAVDVGHDQLHEKLSADPRILNLQGVNARDLDAALIPEPVGVISCDVSFVSLLKILQAPLALAADGCWLAALVKPQFEVGPAHVGKGGIVRDEAAVEDAIRRICDWIAEQPGWRIEGLIPSPIKGRHGNQEYILCARKGASF